MLAGSSGRLVHSLLRSEPGGTGMRGLCLPQGQGRGWLRRSRGGCWLGQHLCPTFLGWGNSTGHLLLQGSTAQGDHSCEQQMLHGGYPGLLQPPRGGPFHLALLTIRTESDQGCPGGAEVASSLLIVPWWLRAPSFTSAPTFGATG